MCTSGLGPSPRGVHQGYVLFSVVYLGVVFSPVVYLGVVFSPVDIPGVWAFSR